MHPVTLQKGLFVNIGIRPQIATIKKCDEQHTIMERSVLFHLHWLNIRGIRQRFCLILAIQRRLHKVLAENGSFILFHFRFRRWSILWCFSLNNLNAFSTIWHCAFWTTITITVIATASH